ncbi:Phosphatidylinositol 3-kinase 3 [Cavenderia fasciculata]|uniref:Phosphatidylinositol 3-kinase 3 n=1 Tax=Cavenderia fasciculata TaxID=261658 RepID=F4PYA6_CACFS|nr:Phosphatidylinositol 3-kinase 3 [Cavenderia fasciculata]EGG19373.1 Phosphatidylinositol 3-kinase 3 [Cavenderia fasciculata]|eukprot:XP_004357644.1 Phosphatidylinositol 3-kinase 3 [Cavenderia fasciculata]
MKHKYQQTKLTTLLSIIAVILLCQDDFNYYSNRLIGLFNHHYHHQQQQINIQQIIASQTKSITSYSSLFVEAVGQCETLGPDSCLTAYPDCMIIPLRGCCFGIGSICVSATYNYARDPAAGNITKCLRNLVTNQVYQLDYDFQNISGYAIYDPIVEDCESAKCEQKNLDCKMMSGQCENPTLKCCSPAPVCFEKKLARGECDNNCKDGFICKIVNDVNTCLPTSCDYLVCDIYSECYELEDLNIAACYLKLNSLPIKPGCKDTPCPPGFQCSHGIFTDYDCVPLHNDVFHGPNGCALCPPGFTCDEFGWGTLCTEWSFNNPVDGDDCFGSKCLFKQHCNQTTQRCEFSRCRDDPSLCKGGMQCIQFDVTHPRVCATTSIIPVSEYSAWANQFPFVSSAPGFDAPPETLNRVVEELKSLNAAQSRRVIQEEHGFDKKIQGVPQESDMLARMKKLQDEFNHHIGGQSNNDPITFSTHENDNDQHFNPPSPPRQQTRQQHFKQEEQIFNQIQQKLQSMRQQQEREDRQQDLADHNNLHFNRPR